MRNTTTTDNLEQMKKWKTFIDYNNLANQDLVKKIYNFDKSRFINKNIMQINNRENKLIM